jgi:hypothetical protein
MVEWLNWNVAIGWFVHYTEIQCVHWLCTKLHKHEQKDITKTLAEFPNHVLKDYGFLHTVIFTKILWQKSPSFRGRALDLMYIKLSGALLVHKTSSKLTSYEFKWHFKPSIFVRKPFLKRCLIEFYSDLNVSPVNYRSVIGSYRRISDNFRLSIERLRCHGANSIWLPQNSRKLCFCCKNHVNLFNFLKWMS